MTKQKWQIGDVGWAVEWCNEVACYDGTDDIDLDACKQASRLFRDHDQARAFAKEVFPLARFGTVSISRFDIVADFEEEPWLGCHREDSGWDETEYYEGEVFFR